MILSQKDIQEQRVLRNICSADWGKESRKWSRLIGQSERLPSCRNSRSKEAAAAHSACLGHARRERVLLRPVCVCVSAVVAKACLCGAGEADDGVCGAQGGRWCYAVKGRGVRLHPQSALHFQRGWEPRVSHHAGAHTNANAELNAEIWWFYSTSIII